MGGTRLRGFEAAAAVIVWILTVLPSSTWAAAAGQVLKSPDFPVSSSSSSGLSSAAVAGDAAAVPLFVFGASYMDVGENFAAMPFRTAADFWPYGVDFFQAKTTGRSSNGRLIIDHISEGLGQGLLSPYLRSAGASFEHGVSFASSGSTACNSSLQGDGSSSSGLFSLSVQVDQFRVFRQEALAMSKPKTPEDAPRLFPAPEAFSKGVYIFEVGNNDYVVRPGSSEQTDARIPLVLQSMELGLRALYNEGARTFVIMDAYPMACFPCLLSYADPSEFNEDGCVIPTVETTKKHNAGLKVMVTNLKVELVEAKLIIFSIHEVFMSAIRNPSKFGLKYVHKACCGYGGGDYNFNREVVCGRDGFWSGQFRRSTVCENRSEYMMWDAVHPTDAFASHIAQAFLRGENMDPAFHIGEMARPAARAMEDSPASSRSPPEPNSKLLWARHPQGGMGTPESSQTD